MMKKLVGVVGLAAVIALGSGCALLSMLPLPGQGPKFDAQMMLGGYVMPNVQAVYVDAAKANVGEAATREMSGMTTTVAVVGESEGLKVVELTGSMMKHGDKPTVVKMMVDKDGNVKKAYGGVAGTEGTELKVPEPMKPTTAGGDKVDVKEKDLGAEEIAGVKANGKEYTVGGNSSSMWKNDSFPFFGGVLKMAAGGNVSSTVTEYKKSGAEAQLKLPGEGK